MTAFRAISLPMHGALETISAMALMAAPFALGFEPAAAIFSIVLGVLLFGLTLSIYGGEQSVPLSAHAFMDYAFGLSLLVVGAILGLAVGDPNATIFLVGVGVAQIALTASTRFSAPRGAL